MFDNNFFLTANGVLYQINPTTVDIVFKKDTALDFQHTSFLIDGNNYYFVKIGTSDITVNAYTIIATTTDITPTLLYTRTISLPFSVSHVTIQKLTGNQAVIVGGKGKSIMVLVQDITISSSTTTLYYDQHTYTTIATNKPKYIDSTKLVTKYGDLYEFKEDAPVVTPSYGLSFKPLPALGPNTTVSDFPFTDGIVSFVYNQLTNTEKAYVRTASKIDTFDIYVPNPTSNPSIMELSNFAYNHILSPDHKFFYVFHSWTFFDDSISKYRDVDIIVAVPFDESSMTLAANQYTIAYNQSTAITVAQITHYFMNPTVVEWNIVKNQVFLYVLYKNDHLRVYQQNKVTGSLISLNKFFTFNNNVTTNYLVNVKPFHLDSTTSTPYVAVFGYEPYYSTVNNVQLNNLVVKTVLQRSSGLLETLSSLVITSITYSVDVNSVSITPNNMFLYFIYLNSIGQNFLKGLAFDVLTGRFTELGAYNLMTSNQNLVSNRIMIERTSWIYAAENYLVLSGTLAIANFTSSAELNGEYYNSISQQQIFVYPSCTLCDTNEVFVGTSSVGTPICNCKPGFVNVDFGGELVCMEGDCGECGEHQGCVVDGLAFTSQCQCEYPYITMGTECVLPPYCTKQCSNCTLLGRDANLRCVGDCQCECREGTVRNGTNNFCLPIEPLSQYQCDNDAQCIQADVNTLCDTDTNRCECTFGHYAVFQNVTTTSGPVLTFTCQSIDEVLPVSSCWAWGDPHYTAFSGRTFNYHGLCDHVLADINRAKPEDHLVIYGRNYPCGRGAGLACFGALAFKLPMKNISMEFHVDFQNDYYAGVNALYNGAPLTLPYVDDVNKFAIRNALYPVSGQYFSFYPVYIDFADGIQIQFYNAYFRIDLPTAAFASKVNGTFSFFQKEKN